MGKGKKFSGVVRQTLDNRDVLDMFDGVLGAGEVDLNILDAKYKQLRLHVDRFLTLLEALLAYEGLRPFARDSELLTGFIRALRAQFVENFSAALPPPPMHSAATPLALDADPYAGIPKDVCDGFVRGARVAKESNLVKVILVTCKNLVPFKALIENAEELKDRFLVSSAGSQFCPLPDLPINFRALYTSFSRAEDRHFLLVVLHKLYRISHDVYDAYRLPEIDVDKFSHIIVDSVGLVKKQLPGCEDAFRRITDSVDLLKLRFGEYHGDAVASGNPAVIMENFVLDVAKEQSNASPALTRQFRKIISHYKKQASKHSSSMDPKLRTVFDQVNKNFSELDRQTGGADGQADANSEPGVDPTLDEEADEIVFNAKTGGSLNVAHDTDAAFGDDASSDEEDLADELARLAVTPAATSVDGLTEGLARLAVTPTDANGPTDGKSEEPR